MLASVSTEARELGFSVENRLGYDSNVFRRTTNGKNTDAPGDGVWEFSPRVILYEENKNLNYDFRYQPTFEQFFGTKEKTSGVNGIDHAARARVDWQINRADSLGINGSYANRRRLRLSIEDLALDPDPSFIPSDRERATRAFGNVYYRKSFTPVFSSRLDYNFEDRGSSRNAISDTRSHSATLRGDYVLDSRTTVGVAATGRFRRGKINQYLFSTQFGSFAFNPPREVKSTTQTYDISFSIQRALSPTIDVSMQAGPSWVNSTQEINFTNFGPAEKTTNGTLDFFAAANATKKWKNGAFNANYTRSESAGGGTSSASILDRITLNVRHRLNERWAARALASWNRRDVIAGTSSLGNNSRVEGWTFLSSVDRRFSKNWMATVRLRYRLQEEERASRSRSREIETISGLLSITYTFDPIVF